MRSEKKTIIDLVKKKLEGSKVFVLADHTGLTSSQMNELRSLLRAKHSDYMVIKNRLFKRALGEQLGGALGASLTGPTGVALGAGDYAAFLKTIVDFAKKNDAPKLKGGYLDGSILSASQIGVIAALPSREVLLARLIGGMQGPLSGFVYVMKEMVRRLVSVMDQISKKGGSA